MKIAIVTGASSGLGREFVVQMADQFHGLDEIWVIARRIQRLTELEAIIPIRLKKIPLDLTQMESLYQLEQILKENSPEVKILVNASGYGMIGLSGSIGMKEELEMIDVNCRALCGVTGLVIPYLSANSRIIQFASSAAFLPQPNFAVYAASKAFVLSYSQALNEELKSKGTYVTAICPGPVKTEFFDIAETTGQIPLYKKLVMANPKKVVAQALKDSMMGKPVSVYGWMMKGFSILCKLLPHGLILKIMKLL